MKQFISILIVACFIVTIAPAVLAQDKNPAEKAVDYTGGVVTGSVNTVGEAAKGTTETAVSPIVAFWRNLIGKGKPQEVVTDPVEKGGKTVYDATVNTGKTITGEKK